MSSFTELYGLITYEVCRRLRLDCRISDETLEREAEKIAFTLQLVAAWFPSGPSAITYVLDRAYCFVPVRQAPRIVVEEAIEYIQKQNSNLWGAALKEVGLTAN